MGQAKVRVRGHRKGFIVQCQETLPNPPADLVGGVLSFHYKGTTIPLADLTELLESVRISGWRLYDLALKQESGSRSALLLMVGPWVSPRTSGTKDSDRTQLALKNLQRRLTLCEKSLTSRVTGLELRTFAIESAVLED